MDTPVMLQRGDSRKESTFQKINEIIQYLNASKLNVDGRSVSLDKTPSGMILSALRQVTPLPSSGDGYSGYFRVDLVEDGTHTVTVSVVDGSDETSPIAGCAYYKGVKVDCPKEENIEIAAGFLCLCILDEGNDTYEVSYEIKPAIPAAPVVDDGTALYPLAEIIGPDEDGGWYARQIHTGGIPGAAGSSKPEITTGYAGEFKAVIEGGKLRIINGASPKSSFCGYTDIAGQVPVQEFEVASANGKDIMMIGLSNGTSYSVALYYSGNEPEAAYKSSPIIICSLSSIKLTQQWTGGSVKFSEKYWL